MPRFEGFFGDGALGIIARLGNVPFILAILLYRVTLSPFIGGQCRFEPTCSRYGLEAFRRHGPVRGAWLTVRRVGRCHPFHRGGYDPVPLPEVSRDESTRRTTRVGSVDCDPDGGKGVRTGSGEAE